MLLDLSYLSYPLPPDIQRLYEAGDFARMDRVIRLRLDDPRVPEALKARLDAGTPTTLVDVREQHEFTGGFIPGGDKLAGRLNALLSSSDR